jgi:flagella basal body P-ring formation protein FlgA
MNIQIRKAFFLIVLISISLNSNANIAGMAIDSFFKSYPNLKHSILTKKVNDINCSHPIIQTKLPIRASSRWIVKLVCPDGTKKNVLVRVQERQEVYYATRAINAGTALGALDFKKNELWTDRRVSTLKKSPLGYTTKRYIKKGKKLTNVDVEPFYLVRPGRKMKMHLIRGSLTITMPVEAKDAGNVGDKISFINLRTNKIVVGIIEDEDTAKY